MLQSCSGESCFHFMPRLMKPGYFRYIHIVMVIAAILLPLKSMGVLLGTGGLVIPRFPPIDCLAKQSDASYFAFILPISIISAIGVSMIIIIFWVIITKLGKMKTQSEVSILT